MYGGAIWLIENALVNQLLQEHSVYPFNNLQVYYRHIEDVHGKVFDVKMILDKFTEFLT